MTVQPPKFLQINMIDQNPAGFWNQDDGSNDPWIGYPYQWTVDLTVTAQPTSWNGSKTPFQYDGNDVAVGDWIATSSNGVALQIISISYQDSSSITCIVEDIDRWNILNDPTEQGTGIGPTGNGYLFQLSQTTGIPIVFPIDGYGIDDNFAADLTSRFQSRNDVSNYLKVIQPNHGLVIGQPIVLSSVGYSAAIASQSVDNVVGVVTDSHTYTGDHSYDWFAFNPIGQVVTGLSLPGNSGDLIYVSPTVAGGLTNVKPANFAKALYIQLQTSTTGIYIDRNEVSASGGSSNANSLSVTFDNTATSPILLGTVPGGSRIISATVVVSTAFTDISSTLTIGDTDNNSSVMGEDDNDLSSVCTYEEFPSLQLSIDDVYYAYVDAKTSTTGGVTVTVSYV